MLLREDWDSWLDPILLQLVYFICPLLCNKMNSLQHHCVSGSHCHFIHDQCFFSSKLAKIKIPLNIPHIKVLSKPSVLVSAFCWPNIALPISDFFYGRKHVVQEWFSTCRGGSREFFPCHQHFHPVQNHEQSFAVTDNSSLRKSKHFPLKLLLVPYYEIMIKALPGVCQQNSCWSRCLGTA